MRTNDAAYRAPRAIYSTGGRHFLRYHRLPTWSSTALEIPSRHGLPVSRDTDVARAFVHDATKSRRGCGHRECREREREDLRNGSCAHDRVRVSLRVSGGSRVEPRFWAPALVGRDPAGRNESGRKRAPPPSGGGREGGREIKRDGRHPSLIDEHRSH